MSEDGEEKRQQWSTASSEEVNAGKLLDMLRDSLKTHERRHQSKVGDLHVDTYLCMKISRLMWMLLDILRDAFRGYMNSNTRAT